MGDPNFAIVKPLADDRVEGLGRGRQDAAEALEDVCLFEVQVGPEAAKQSKTIADLAKQFQVHPVQISQWKKQLLDGMETLFGDR